MKKVKKHDADGVVVSEKDAVKLEGQLPPEADTPVWALGISFEITEGEDELWRHIETRLRAATPKIQLKGKG